MSDLYDAPEAEIEDEDDDEDVDVQLDCPVCDGPLFALGSLGRVAHFRCRDCGADHAIDSPAVARALDRALFGS